MGFSILSKAFQPGGLNWRLCPVPVFHRTHAVHAFCKEILIDFPEWKIRFHICKIQCLEHISLISTATNGWEIPKGNGWEGRSYNFQIKLCGKRSAMCGCPVVNERNISKSENLEIFCSQNFDCCSGKSFGENSHFPSTTLLENLVFPFRFRTNLRSKLSISYSTSKKLPTRRSISSVGSGAERTAMNVPKGEPGGNRKTTSPRVKKHLCPQTRCKRGQHSLSQIVLEVCNFLNRKYREPGGNCKKLPPGWKSTSVLKLRTTSCKKGATQLVSFSEQKISLCML